MTRIARTRLISSDALSSVRRRSPRPDGSRIARAQAVDLPVGPIRIILPTAAGGQADTLGRLIGDRVGPAIDRSFVMEPRAGAGGLIAGEYVARAAPDGNTLLFVTGGHTILPGLYAKTIKFDAVKDFAFVCQITESSFAIAVATDHPAKSFADLLEMSKRDPGKLTFSSTGAGSTQHLIGEVAQQRFGVQWTHVPYPGGAMPLNDVIGGRVDMSINSMLTIAAAGAARPDARPAATSLERQHCCPTRLVRRNLSASPSARSSASRAGRTPPASSPAQPEIAKAVNADATRQRLPTMANKAKAGTPRNSPNVAQYVARGPA